MEHSSSSDDDISCAGQQATTNVVVTTTVSATNECRMVVPSRTRRERPPRLRIPNDSDVDGRGATNNEFVPDIESFVSACIGVSFGAETKEQPTLDVLLTQRRTKLIHKRPLPLLSFLSSTHLAAAEKKRKNEERERQNAIAEEQAKKALLLNPIQKSAFETGESLRGGNGAHHAQGSLVGKCSNQEAEAPKVTTTWERTSNLLMPPLLKQFLDRLEKLPRNQPPERSPVSGAKGGTNSEKCGQRSLGGSIASPEVP